MLAIKAHELNPTEDKIILNGEEYTLRKFDLLAQSWAHREFQTENQPNGLMVLSEKMKSIHDDLDLLLQCCWHLLKEKRKFGSFESFCLSVAEEGERQKSQVTVMGHLLKAFTYTLGVSSISDSDVKEDESLKKH